MKIALVAQGETFQINDLITEATKLGHEIEMIKLQEIEITNPNNDKNLNKLKEFDAVLFRSGADQVTKMIVGQTLANSGVKFVNSGYYLNPLLSNKIYQTYVASQNDIRTPKTITIKSQSLEDFEKIEQRLGLPFIAKPSNGAKGNGVFLVKNKDDFVKMIENKATNMIFQEYIPNDGDFRVLVIGHKAVNTFKRVPPKNDFRANISQGGHGELVTDEELKNKLFNIAEKITKALNLEVAGIDIIKSTSNNELYFIESNSIPQWEGFSKTTGINIALEIINYLSK